MDVFEALPQGRLLCGFRRFRKRAGRARGICLDISPHSRYGDTASGAPSASLKHPIPTPNKEEPCPWP